MWVFAYGSLLWNPGFEPIEDVRASLTDFRRSFCMWSIHHRGTEDHPGLVLALDAAEGESCTGQALRVHPDQEAAVLEDLRARELISSAYVERVLPVWLDDGRTVEALAYVIDQSHSQYCQLTLEQQAEVIAGATGGRGPNWEYLSRTCERFAALGSMTRTCAGWTLRSRR